LRVLPSVSVTVAASAPTPARTVTPPRASPAARTEVVRAEPARPAPPVQANNPPARTVTPSRAQPALRTGTPARTQPPQAINPPAGRPTGQPAAMGRPQAPAPAGRPPKPTISLDDLEILHEAATPPAPAVAQPAPTTTSPTPLQRPAPPADAFAVVRKAGVNPVAAWFRSQPPEAALGPAATVANQNEDEAVAAACFERGLSLVSERRPLDAVLYWERAVALAPTCSMYQENLRRLINQIKDRRDMAGPPTPPPGRTIRKAE
jgi:hypothetical protein